VPRSTAQLPQRFDHLAHPTPIGEDEHPDSYDPLYPFGHGLSYTEFAYRDLSLSAETVGPAGVVEATVTVENVGDRTGTETVLAFLRDEFATRVTPVRELAGYGAVTLDPGETATTTVRIPLEEHGVVHTDGRRVVETGEFTVGVEDHTATFEVTSRY
jgi:beta-glucosidase